MRRISAYTPDISLSQKSVFVLVALSIFLIAMMILVRYNAMWAETDSATFTGYIHSILQTAKIIPTPNEVVSGGVYGNGYGYQAMGVLVIYITGLSLASFQLTGGILFATWVVLPTWLFYYKLLEQKTTAALATLLFFSQPDILFPLFRATHEKFTRGLMFLALYFFLCGLRSRSKSDRLLGFVLGFYLSVYGMLAYNNLLAASFIAGLGFTLVLYLIATHSRIVSSEVVAVTSANANIQKLAYSIVVSIILSFLFVFYLYPPAQLTLYLSNSIWKGILLFFASVEQHLGSITPPNLELVNQGWRNFGIYVTINSATWLLVLSSLFVWLWTSGKLLTGRYISSSKILVHDGLGVKDLTLWAFYGGFGFLGAFALLMDTVGVVASNFQLRIYPAIAVFAAPLVASELSRWKKKKRQWLNAVIYAAILCLLFGLSLLKSTNEPFVSNKWTYILPAEINGHVWMQDKLQSRYVWYGFDERLRSGLYLNFEAEPPTIIIDQFAVSENTSDFFISNITAAYAQRQSRVLPISAGDFITYDNGYAQVYHRRPITPYQK